jgi:hypothetical protein
MLSDSWAWHYWFTSYVSFVRWELSKRGFSDHDICEHLARHEHYEELIMTDKLLARGKKDDWLAVLQEAHRYIIHYSTVRLSLVTFLVTAMLTAVLYGIPKETVTVTPNSVITYKGGVNWWAIFVAVLFYCSAVSLNWVFDRRRYIMERFAADVESILNARIVNSLPLSNVTTTARPHHLDHLGEHDVNIIVNLWKNQNLETAYSDGFTGYTFFKKPLLNCVITWAFAIVGLGLLYLVFVGYPNAYEYENCSKSGDRFSCSRSLVKNHSVIW